MVEQQVRPWDVLDPRVLDVLAALPREDFVPPAHRKLAFADLPLPLAHGEVMMKPVVEGRAAAGAGTRSRATRCWRSAPAAASSPPAWAAWRAKWSASTGTPTSPTPPVRAWPRSGIGNVRLDHRRRASHWQPGRSSTPSA